jgi:VanZ family protein
LSRLQYRIVSVFALLVTLLALGGCTEWLQAEIPGRGPDTWDVIADAAGAAVGVTLGLYFLRRKPPLS